MDAFPTDPAASVDVDGDEHPDLWNEGKTEEDSTTGLRLDHYPNDPDRWKKEEKKIPAVLIVIVVAILLMIIGSGILMVFRRKRHEDIISEE
ncbi:MAG: hypothetical protein JXA22_09755, partial [Candidatus Thermoplasmatota archaeon]|nr:hypothetical protein [Candidatus Thermoplasmatota archaeon]